MRAVALAFAVLAGAVQAQTGPHFIHGSWVNVRESAAATARATEQLTTNTPVEVTARQGDWCALRHGAGRTGFVACNLLGPQPLTLTLAQAASAPARAFWIAPSPNRLAAYGQSLPPPAALRLEVLKKTVQAGEPVRYPAVAEFEAAKKRMKAGVVLNPAQEIARPAAVDIAAVLKAYRLRPAPIKPSLFRTHESVALVSETDADGIAAVAGSKVSLTPVGPPVGWFARHDGPEIEGVTGFWDVGSASLAFDPPVTIYSVAANGLVAATALRKLPFTAGGEGHYCGAHYEGRSLPSAWSITHGGSDEGVEMSPLKGYPLLTDGSERLAGLVVRGKPLAPSARVRTSSEVVKGFSLPKFGNPEADAQVKALKPRLVMREIDFDGDGVADLLQIEYPIEVGQISLGPMLHRSWYLNINGQWFAAGDWEDEDCT